MERYWEDRRNREEKEAREKELAKIVSLSFEEEATEYDKLSNQKL
jgi:hypothetical protein